MGPKLSNVSQGTGGLQGNAHQARSGLALGCAVLGMQKKQMWPPPSGAPVQVPNKCASRRRSIEAVGAQERLSEGAGNRAGLKGLGTQEGCSKQTCWDGGRRGVMALGRGP